MDDPATPNTLSALTQAIASGDPSAFARFYDEWFDRLYRIARSNTGRDESFCLDVVQDSMLKIMRSMKRFEQESELEAWLRVVVMRCSLDRLRSERRRAVRESNHALGRAVTGGGDASKADERTRWLERQLAQLDHGRSLLLAMRFRLGITLEHIGRAVGLGPGAVDGRIGRSLARLRAAAQEEFDEP